MSSTCSDANIPNGFENNFRGNSLCKRGSVTSKSSSIKMILFQGHFLWLYSVFPFVQVGCQVCCWLRDLWQNNQRSRQMFIFGMYGTRSIRALGHCLPHSVEFFSSDRWNIETDEPFKVQKHDESVPMNVKNLKVDIPRYINWQVLKILF